MLEDKDLRSVQEVRTRVTEAYEAFLQYKSFSQEQVDAIVDAVAAAARANAESLARMAVEETGYGNVPDKVAKNLLNSDTLHRYIRPMKTVGILHEDEAQGLIEIAEPVGVIAAILPTTNPTSTAFYKSLIALKSGNAVVISPHPRANRCTCEASRILLEAAVAAGAPEGIIQCVNEATIAGTNELMRHKRTSIVLSTGGPGIVRAAYSSGKPALGVGPGNVPVLVDSSADVDEAVASVVDGKSFDFGTVCSSEQTLVIEESARDRVWAALKANDAFVCNEEQTAAIEALLITSDFRINPDCVGQSPQKIAEMAGFSVPLDARILALELWGIGRDYPLSAEKLSPVLSVYFVKSFEEGIEACRGVLNFGGRGHTCVIYSKDRERIKRYGVAMPAYRVLVNTSSPQGSTGITTNVAPAMTLGCGAIAGNSTSDNVGPLHLINIKRIAFKVREAEEAFTSEEGRRFMSGESLPQPAAVPVAAAPVSGAGISDAVSRYLAKRGLPTGSAPASAPAPVRSATPKPAASVASVVDRFLSGRARPADSAPAPTAVVAPPEEPRPPAPVIRSVAFVCEGDVRRARDTDQKIYIDSRTIVTPAARDLDSGDEIIIKTD